LLGFADAQMYEEKKRRWYDVPSEAAAFVEPTPPEWQSAIRHGPAN
jgi:hypothetical protein